MLTVQQMHAAIGLSRNGSPDIKLAVSHPTDDIARVLGDFLEAARAQMQMVDIVELGVIFVQGNQ